MALTQTQVSELYVSIFNRASEQEGNDYWAAMDKTAAEIADAMLATDAAKTYFGTALDDDAAFVEHIYANTLNKAGADVDADGKAYWVQQLTDGATRGEMVAAMVAAIAEYAPDGAKYDANDAATVAAYNQFVNRVEVSDYTAQTLATIAVEDIDSTLSFASALTVTDDAATITAAKDAADAANPANAGSTLELTDAADTLIGSSLNDTINGTSATIQLNDVIIDQSTEDNDTLNVELTAINNAFKVAGIENINVDWNAFGTAAFDATNVAGSTITGTSSKTGFLGSMTITAAGENTIVAGSGMTGTLTVNGATTSTVEAGEAKTVSVTSAGTATADDTLTLTAGDNTTTITAADFNNMTINAGTAETITLTDDDAASDDEDTATLNYGADVSVTNNVDDLVINATASDLTLTI